MKPAWTEVALSELMIERARNVDPAKSPDEVFELFSVPAFEDGAPVTIRGADIGSVKQEVQRGDVLLSKIVPHIRRSWIVSGTSSNRLLASGEWIVFRSQHFDSSYLRHLLVSDRFHAQLMTTVAGVGGSLLRARPASVARLKVHLPPLDEQRRIARLFDVAQGVGEARRSTLRLISALTRARFVELFGDPDRNPCGWDMQPVSHVVAAFEGGRSFAGSDDDDPAAEYRVLRVSAVTSGSFRAEESRPVPRGYMPPDRHKVTIGDLLISRANTSELVGAVALVDRNADGLLLPDKIWRFRWEDQAMAVPEFVWQLFQTRAVRAAISRRATGTSGSMKNISAEKLMAIQIIQPPLELQREFARFFRRSVKLRVQAAAHLAQLEDLVATLQHRAFTGAP